MRVVRVTFPACEFLQINLHVGIMLLSTMLMVGCSGSDGSACARICTWMNNCYSSAGITTPVCPFNQTCDASEQCKIDCYDSSDCDSLTMKNKAGHASLQACLNRCGKSSDLGPKKDTLRTDTKEPDSFIPLIDGCVKKCQGKQCGSDGCGGTCAPGCVLPKTCDSLGQCTCTPKCQGKQCGDDGCGSTCPPGCTAPETCSTQYKCEGPELSCKSIFGCVTKCSATPSCITACVSQGCAQAQTYAQKVFDCFATTCVSDCTGGLDSQCETCLQNNCTADYNACQNHTSC